MLIRKAGKTVGSAYPLRRFFQAQLLPRVVAQSGPAMAAPNGKFTPHTGRPALRALALGKAGLCPAPRLRLTTGKEIPMQLSLFQSPRFVAKEGGFAPRLETPDLNGTISGPAVARVASRRSRLASSAAAASGALPPTPSSGRACTVCGFQLHPVGTCLCCVNCGTTTGCA